MKSALLLFVILVSTSSFAQHDHESTASQQPTAQGPAGHTDMAGMDHEHMQHDESMTLLDQTLHRSTAGTSVAPLSTPLHMLMKEKWGWNWMLHGQVFVNALQQSGPRGGDKVFSTNWFMPMAQKDLGEGRITFKAMLSLEPATVTDRRYPELFQLGETAFGRSIVDGQHPHDFIGELAAVYDSRLGEQTLLSFYGGVIGDPAMGPESYPHRSSAAENPMAPLGHHLQDSTHIASDVFTLGLTHKMFRIEASGFHGREPNENRWNIDQGGIDSWSTRFSIAPGQNWAAQFSIAGLHSPEELHPNEDVVRMTASISYNRRLAKGNWSSMLLWGRNRFLDEFTQNSYLAESTLRFADKNYVWTRIENVDRTNELLLDGNTPPAGFHEEPYARVQAYTVGYSRDIANLGAWSMGIGGQVNWYGIPDKLRPTYGDHPHGALIYVRFRPSSSAH